MRITDADIELATTEWVDDLKYCMDNYSDEPKIQQARDNLLFLEKQLQAKGFTFEQICEVKARATWRILSQDTRTFPW